MRENNVDKLADKTIKEMGLSAGPKQNVLQLSKLSKQKNNAVKKLRQDIEQMADIYAVYDLNVSSAKKLINRVHRQQSNLLNINFKKQQVLRQVLTESQFKVLSDRVSKQTDRF
jgi:hypothetical protein